MNIIGWHIGLTPYCNNFKPQKFNGCKQFNSVIIQTDVFDMIQPEVFALACQLDNTMHE